MSTKNIPAQKELKLLSFYFKKIFNLKIVKIILLFIILVTLLPLLLFYFLKPTVQSNINYGVTFSKKYSMQMGMDWKDTYLKILDDLGAKNLRLVVYWDDVEKTKDTYDYSDIKWQLDEAEKRNLNVILSLGRKVPRYPECFEPMWWKQTKDADIKNNELYEYVKQTVKELKSYNSIKIWQVENEPFWPFGECSEIEKSTIENEIKITRSLDRRPILVQDSGEGGVWYPTYKMGDFLGISMYRKIWYNFWGVFFGRFIYFQYPLSYWSYKIKADLVGVPYQKIIVTELQAEPWGPGLNSTLSKDEQDKTMSEADFISTVSYAQKAGFKDIYFWGAEWWLLEKEKNNRPFFWDAAKALMK